MGDQTKGAGGDGKRWFPFQTYLHQHFLTSFVHSHWHNRSGTRASQNLLHLIPAAILLVLVALSFRKVIGDWKF